MKRFLTLTLAVALVLACAPVIPLQADAATSGYYTYSVNSGEATIGYVSASISGDVIIPTELGGYPVTGIDYRAFMSCTKLTSVTIPDSVTSIGEEAFYKCTSLTSVTTGNGATTIGDFAFFDCTGLTNVNIGNSVTTIGVHAFKNCISLTSISIPDSVTNLYAGAFYKCTSLNSVTIGNNVKAIGEYVFYGCTSLTSITIPDSVTKIYANAFQNCTNLKHVAYGGTSAQWNKINIAQNNSDLEGASVWHYRATDINVSYINNCINAGIYCNLCGEFITKEKEESGTHSYDYICDEECNACREIRTVTHSYEWIIDKPATCSENGVKHEECMACHIVRNAETIIMATGKHTYDNDYDATCNGCGYDRIVEHSYEWIIDKLATCSENGSKHEECTECRAIRNAGTVIKATGHTLSGEDDTECNVCGQIFIIVQFNSNGGTGVSQIKRAASQQIILPLDRPVKLGYNFAGWSTTRAGNAQYQPNDTIQTDKSITLYAQWNKHCSTCSGTGEVTCTSCSGTGAKQHTVTCYNCQGGMIYCTRCWKYIYMSKADFIAHCDTYGPVRCSCGNSGSSYGNGADIYTHFAICLNCDATGKQVVTVACGSCIGSGQRYCSSCAGSGEVSRTKVSAPDAPTLNSADESSITLNAITNGEYSLDGTTWQDSPIFENLEPGKEYSFYQRYAKTDTTLRSAASAVLIVKTAGEPVYTVTFKNWDGTVINTDTYHYGDKVTAPLDPARAADSTYTYTFAGWDKEVVDCNGDAIYTAIYTSYPIGASVEYRYMDNGVEKTFFYETLEEALATATSGTIKLLTDLETGNLIINPNVTLDLNGYTLTADIVLVMNGAAILDGGAACTGGGLLKVPEDNFGFMRENGLGIIPVWNGVDGYVFTKVTFQQMARAAGEGAAQYIFLPSFSNANAAALLADGSLDNGLKIKVCLTWNNGQSQQFYTYDDGFVTQVFASNGGLAFSLTVTGIAGITDMTASAMIVTDSYAQVTAIDTALVAGA